MNNFLHSLFVHAALAPRRNLADKTIVITGCGVGSLGFATAKILAQRGAQLIISTRQNASDTARKISQIAGVSECRVMGFDVDLSDKAATGRFADLVQAQAVQLDVLINNAGVHLDLMRQHKTPQIVDGHEIHWRINYLGPAQLTHALLPNLLATAQAKGDARVVNVASMLHSKGQNKYLFLPQEKHDSWVSYGTSKLALMHLGTEIERRYGSQGLHAYNLHPGAVYTNVASKGLAGHEFIGSLRRLLAPVERTFMLTPDEGAQTTVLCAGEPHLLGGKYYRNCAVAAHHPEVDDLPFAQKLWDETLKWIHT